MFSTSKNKYMKRHSLIAMFQNILKNQTNFVLILTFACYLNCENPISDKFFCHKQAFSSQTTAPFAGA